MSFKDPAKMIAHTPSDISLKPEPKSNGLRFFCFLSALVLVFGALVKGAWQ